MKKSILLFSLVLAVSPLFSKSTGDWEKAINEKLDQSKPLEAQEILKEWKSNKGESDPQYWVAGGNIWIAMGYTVPAVISNLPVGKYKIGKATDDSIPIQDKKTGKTVGQITDGPPQIDRSKMLKAIDCLDHGVQVAPQRLDIFTGRAHLYRLMGDLKGELKALESLATDPKPKGGRFEDGPGSVMKKSLTDYQVDMLNAYAREHFEKETAYDDNAGVQVAQLLIRKFPKYAQGYNLMAAAASFKGDWKGSVLWLDKALAVAPADSLVWANKGRGLEKLKDPAGARKCYEKIIQLNNDPDYVKAAKEELMKLK